MIQFSTLKTGFAHLACDYKWNAVSLDTFSVCLFSASFLHHPPPHRSPSITHPHSPIQLAGLQTLSSHSPADLHCLFPQRLWGLSSSFYNWRDKIPCTALIRTGALIIVSAGLGFAFWGYTGRLSVPDFIGRTHGWVFGEINMTRSWKSCVKHK